MRAGPGRGWLGFAGTQEVRILQSDGAATGGNVAPAPAPGSAWAPFHHRLFAAMWGAQFVSNVGSWMQTLRSG